MQISHLIIQWFHGLRQMMSTMNVTDDNTINLFKQRYSWYIYMWQWLVFHNLLLNSGLWGKALASDLDSKSGHVSGSMGSLKSWALGWRQNGAVQGGPWKQRGRRSNWQMSEGTDSCWSSGFEAEDVEWMVYQASKVWAPMRNLTDGWDLEKFRRKVVFWYAHVCTWICVHVYWRPEKN